MSFSIRTCLAALSVLAVSILASASAQCKPVDIQIEDMQGKILYMKTATGTWEKATGPITVTEGCKIKTRPGSTCLMKFNGHSLKVQPRTVAAIEKADVTGKTETTLIVVESGNIVADIEELSDKHSTLVVRVPGYDIISSGVGADTKVVPRKDEEAPPKQP